MNEIRDKLTESKVRAPARNGAIAPCEVIIPAQNTGLGPEKTSFFQALSIPTKISKGTIEIINDVPILKPGDKVGASEATLLNMLNISPFSYGLLIEQVYDSGSIFSPEILDIKPEDLRAKFQQGVANLAAVSLQIGYPTLASAPHSIANGFKNLLALAATTDVEFKEAETIKEYIKDPTNLLLPPLLLHQLLKPRRKKRKRKRRKKPKNLMMISVSVFSTKLINQYFIAFKHYFF